MGRGSGVEARATSIRIFFVWQNHRYRETLTLNGQPIKPTPANLRYAERTAAEIRDRIRLGSFAIADFFPDSARAGQQSKSQATFDQVARVWLKTKGRLAQKTQDQYDDAIKVWARLFGADTPIASITHTKIASVIGSQPWASAKLLNNYLIPLRGVFDLASRDLGFANPMAGIENSRHQPPQPDPLTREEARAVLAYMSEQYDPRVACYFTFAFATGMRPEEIIALRWSDIDWRTATARVERARTAGTTKPLKTYHARDVDLVAVALQALRGMKPWTFMAGPDTDVFQSPITGRPWYDDRSQRDNFWTPTMRRLGIRSRRAYATRHTYATAALVAGVNPAYIARQLGHKNSRLLFTTYSKWIDGADRGREKAKMEGLLQPSEAARSSL